MKTIKRFLSILLSLVMVLGLIPGMSLAANAASHNITINNSQNGSVAASVNSSTVTSAEEGATVTLVANPENGYRLKSISGTYKGYPTETLYNNAEGTYFKAESDDTYSTGWTIRYSEKPIIITSKNSSVKIDKVKLNIIGRGNSANQSTLSTTVGDLSLSGNTIMVSSVNSTTVTITNNSNNAGLFRIGSVTVYPVEIENVDKTLLISETSDTNVKTFTMPEVAEGAVSITAEFEEIPKYEVTYKVVNGTWSDDSTTDKTETVQSGAKPASVPTGMKAASGYTGGAWDTDPADATITGATTFTYTFTALPTYTVTYKVVNGTWSDDSTTNKKETVQSGSKPASVPAGMKAASGYTGGSWDNDPADATITGATTFTYTFTAKQAATVTKAPEAKTLTYTGSAQELVTAGTATGGEMQYALGTKDAATEEYTTSIPAATDAGTYYVWYKAKGDVNHNDSEAGCVSVTVYTPTYTVTYKVVGGTWSDDSTTDKTETVVSGSKPASAPTGMKAASGYTGGAWDTNPAETTITGTTTFTYIFTSKSTATVTKIPTAKSLTYTGSAQELVTAGEASGGTMQYALGTATEATEQYTTSIPTATEAGTYYVWYKAVGDANHNDSEAAFVSVQIASKIEAKVTFKVVNGSWDDGTTEDKTVTLTGKQGDTLKLLADQIPTVGNKPNDTYKSGSWDVAPGTDTAITTATTYTYIYAQKDVAPQPQPQVTPSIAIDGGDFELIKGSTKNLTVKLVPEGTAVTYSSSNEEIAAVDSEGRVIANSVGTAVITAKITVEEKDYTSSVTVTVTEESTKESTIVSSELTDGNIPDEIKAQGLDTKEKVEQKLEEALSISSEQKENIAVRDVRLIIKENGVERAATAEDFPEDGLDVLLEYPEGTNKDDFIFNVAHMIAETVGGYQAGSVETPGCSNTDEGIRTKFHGLSPVLITWSKRDSSEPVEKKESHVHEFSWDTVAATEDQDGELRYQCKECGHILTRVPLSAYYVFNANAVEKITKAKQGETVKVTTDRWISFHKMVFDSLAARPDVSLEVSFLDEEYKGNRVSFTIPAAADTSDLFTEDNFVGFMYLGNKYGLMAEEN